MDLSPEEDNFPGRLLHQASLWDNAELVEDLVSSEGGLVDAADGWGRTALHAAAACEKSRCLPILLGAGADPNKACGPRGNCKTPLHIAAERGETDNVGELLVAGASWSVRDSTGQTPLLLAELAGHTSTAKLLKETQDECERLRAARHAELRVALASGALLRGPLAALGPEAGLIVNMAPAGANTLLFTASEMGLVEAVRALVAAGADGRSHPVTRYSPLYVACYHGNRDIAETLLLHFPEMMQQQTVERWLPLHACCINGHVELVSLLLDFPYPERLMTKLRDISGEWEYQAVFDINHRDVSGQTALYVACLLGNRPIVDILLRHTVKAVKVSSQKSDPVDEPSTPSSTKIVEPETIISPTRRRISVGIQSIMSRLSISSKHPVNSQESPSEFRFRPVYIDAVIGATRDTCLRAAIRGGHTEIAQALLAAGADPNAPSSNIQLSSSVRASAGSMQSQGPSYSSTNNNIGGGTPLGGAPSPSPTPDPISLPALVEACKARNIALVDLLLKHGALDLNCLALREAADLGDETLVARLLAIKAYPDPEYKINKRGMTESMSLSGLLSPSAPAHTPPGLSVPPAVAPPHGPLLTYSAMFPSSPAMLNWHNQSSRLATIKMTWIQEAAMHVNPRLKSSPRGRAVALHAVTRIDISANALTSIPLEILQMTSLRYLNVAQNKLERLPTNLDAEDSVEEPVIRGRRSRRSNAQQLNPDEYYTAPFLEEIYLQENRLEQLPDALFSLPALTTLDVSNNKLRKLPYAMWRAPRLRDLNASLNLLRDLPTRTEHVSLAEEAANSILSPTSPCQDTRFPSSNSSGQLSVSSGHSSTNGAQRRSWSVDRVTGSRSESSRDSFSADGPLDEESMAGCKKADGVMQQELRRHHLWTRGLRVAERPPSPPPSARRSRLTSLNLAHNQLASVPAGLPCLAPRLQRLCLAYNALRTMSHLTSYPNSVRQLDLSHNQITCWPSLPQVDSWGPLEQAHLWCYCPGSVGGAPRARARSAGGVRKAVLAALCPARRHLRLDGLRTLVLADNLLTRIQLTTDDDGGELLDGGERGSVSDRLSINGNNNTDDDDDWNLVPVVRTRLIFPNLSMLDVSNNMLRSIPPAIHELSNLSVLNVSGNADISELPPQMGLLSRLWNLNTNGCSLQEPLRSMIESKKYKTMDIIGYLKSVLEDAKPYARMKLMVVGIQGIGKTSLLERLRQESAPAHRRRGPEHWAKRMGNKNVNTKTSRGSNMSTVGVDIGDWIYDRHPSRSSQRSHGPVVFRTWDFGGQKEYYSTHQYFLSRRSLYIVVWRVPDGISGLAGIQHWLVSIQARAPNSPVIIVGTHYDVVGEMSGEHTPEQLQRIIRERFISVADPEKRGLPRVLDSVEVSCATRHNIRLLANLVYDTVFSLRQPGSKELLLEQRVPASYLALEDAVGVLATERRSRGLDPVLTHEQFKSQVAQYMQQKFHRSFRDQAELHQATMFLHDNGVLLHYDDATLKDLYFLDPQWLCDMLAHVVTVREINPFARSGVMRLEDMQLLFKSSRAGDSRDYVVSLLNKFELALSWDGRSLLLPPLLPASEPPLDCSSTSCVKIPLKSRGWTARGLKKIAVSPLSILNQTVDGLAPSGTIVATNVPCGPATAACVSHGRANPLSCLRRLLLASYSPCGFWPRLITRLLADDTVPDIVDHFYPLPDELSGDSAVRRVLSHGGEWCVWQSGVRLLRSGVLLLSIKELPQEHNIFKYARFKLKQEGIWCDVDTASSSILEIILPADEMIIKKPITDEQGETIGYQNITLEPSMEAMAKLLVLAVDHIDILLEDWYPTLGTRFVHTSEGRFLVTRLIPCPQCLLDTESGMQNGGEGAPKLNGHGADHIGDMQAQFNEAFKRAPGADNIEVAVGVRPRASQDSCASDGDSGVGPDSTGSSRMPSMEGVVSGSGGVTSPAQPLHAWTVEECILQASNNATVDCPLHQEVKLVHIAPDVMFLDLGSRRLANSSEVVRGALAGRGAFGLVFRAEWKGRGPVALKVLQPVPPGPRAPNSALQAYRAAAARWERDPMQAACRAYLSARAELGVLLPLRHPNIAPLLAACTAPLALVLALAPMGALDCVLRGYRQSGARLGPHCAQAVAVQAARALEYLHRQRIIYRDLKAENVLVWEMPPPVGPFKDHPGLAVHIKVADYGISRLSLPSGTKGFGGTEGFMAPEIMRYNGEEEYTEKVDCFSFGMFLYELLTLRQPFEGHEAVKECILEGGRPPLTHKETLYPCYMLDLMVACWSGQPEQRPSASQIVSIASAPEFTHLADVASLYHAADVTNATATQMPNITDEGTPGWEIWVTRCRPRCDVLATANARFLNYHALPAPPVSSQEASADEPIIPTAVCSVGDRVWIGDSVGRIHAYNASDCQHLFSYALESVTLSCRVAALVHLPSLARVAAALSNGRLFLLDNVAPPLSPTMGEGTFVMTELGAATALHCLAAVSTDEYCELWCGGSAGGSLWVYRLVLGLGAAGARELPCPAVPTSPCSRVLHAVASHNTVCTYVYPGCVIYQWDAVKKTVIARLDCSKLVPCSESLRSISIEEHLSPGRCQVTSLAVLNDDVYIGTTWGCIIIAERETLRPVTIFRPYEEEVRAIIPLPAYNVTHDGGESCDGHPGGGMEEEPPLIATIGRGYRSLLARYTDTSNQSTPASNLSQGPAVMHCLLWRAEHWAAN